MIIVIIWNVYASQDEKKKIAFFLHIQKVTEIWFCIAGYFSIDITFAAVICWYRASGNYVLDNNGTLHASTKHSNHWNIPQNGSSFYGFTPEFGGIALNHAYFQQDGATYQTSNEIIDRFWEKFPIRVFPRKGNYSWPLRSHFLTLYYCFLYATWNSLR